MSNFWAQKLGIAPQAPPAAAPAPGAPWYAPYQQPAPPPQYQPAPPGYPQAPPGYQLVPVQATPEPEHQGWGNPERSRLKAKSAKLNDLCPNCGSGNIFRATQNAIMQCFECGDNSRFSQTGGDGGLPSGSAGAAEATPAIQIAGAGKGGVSQFRPDVIIDHIK